MFQPTPVQRTALLALGDEFMDQLTPLLVAASKGADLDLDALKALPCPRCSKPVGVLSTVTRNLSPLGLPVGPVDVELDLMPMAEHIADCALTGGAR